MRRVKTVSVSKPIDTELSPEDSIVHMARVSSPNSTGKDPLKLLRYLVENSHWSPFDMVHFCVEIHTERSIMPQILRHWSFRFQEFSQRYSPVTLLEDHSEVEIRDKAKGGNRQGSGDKNSYLTRKAARFIALARQTYAGFLKRGASPETARQVLTSFTPTRAYMDGSVRSWMTYFWQRLDAHAQKEHRQLAWEIFREFEKSFPVIAALVLSGRPRFVLGDWVAPEILDPAPVESGQSVDDTEETGQQT